MLLISASLSLCGSLAIHGAAARRFVPPPVALNAASGDAYEASIHSDADELFSRIDDNADGFICFTELSAHLSERG